MVVASIPTLFEPILTTFPRRCPRRRSRPFTASLVVYCTGYTCTIRSDVRHNLLRETN